MRLHDDKSNIARGIAFTVILVLIPLLFSLVSTSSEASCNRIILEVYPDGSVLVNTTLNVVGAPTNISITLLGSALYAYAEDQDGIPLPIDYTNTTATVTAYSNGSIQVSYYTLDITRKEGDTWIIDLKTGCDTIVLLPSSAIPVEMKPTPTPIIIENNTGFDFTGGELHIKYYVLPTQIGAGQTPAPTPTTSPSTAMGGKQNVLMTVAIVIILLAVIAVYLLRRTSARSKAEITSSSLDSRDKAILKALEEGPKSAPEIMQETGIPKTPLYRRLKRLVEDGYIDFFEEGGVRKYRLKKP